MLTYHGFYDDNLEWVGLEGVQIIASMNSGSTLGRHALSTRFTSIVRICCVGYPDTDQLETIYSTLLRPILHQTLSSHPVWGSTARVHTLASSMVQLYKQVLGLVICM